MTRIVIVATMCVAHTTWVSAQSDVTRSAIASPIIILIGGNHSDPTPAQIAGRSGGRGNSGLYRLKQDLESEEQLKAEYFNWNGTRAGHIADPQPGGTAAIVKTIRDRKTARPPAPVIIVGNSWGGHTAWEAASQLSVAEEDPPITVDLMVFLDPSSLGRCKDPKPTLLPDNVERAVNYFTQNRIGWREWPNEPRLSNINLGDPDNGYLTPGGPRYDASFSLAAHVAAEWDERIHADIRKRIVETIRKRQLR